MLPLHAFDERALHFHAVDEHAKQASFSDSATYESLVAYLRRPLLNDPNEELLLARALVVWACHVQSSDLSREAYDTPRGLLQHMRMKNIEHSRVFKMLCGYAGIECEIVQGRAKAIRYQAGDSDSSYIQGRHTWNAFKAGDQWYLMHPEWCVQSYVGFVHGGQSRIEKDGQHEIKQTVHKDGDTLYKLNDFWFCTNPEIFATRCLPNDANWQCLPKDKIVKSVQDFLSVPDLRQGFYRQKLKLLHPKSCVIQVSDGKCTITLLAPKNRGQELRFSYELLATYVGNLDINKIPLLVLFIPNNPPDTFNFEISFPAVGLYRLKIRVGVKGHNSPLINCCEFMINCKAADPNCRKLPVDTGIQGWGYGPDAKDAGLKRPSVSGAKIPLKPTAPKAPKGQLQSIVEFNLDGDAVDENEYSADIYTPSDSLGDIKEKAVVDVDKQKRKMKVQAKDVGNLSKAALVIRCKDKTDPASKAEPVASYMLTSDKDVVDKKANAATKKEIKEARNQEKLEKALERNKLLKSEKEKKKQDMEELLKRIADNESCD